MELGVFLLFDGQPGLTLTDCARESANLEAMGFASLWVPDNVVTFESYRPLYHYDESGVPPFSARQGWYDPLWTLAAVLFGLERLWSHRRRPASATAPEPLPAAAVPASR